MTDSNNSGFPVMASRALHVVAGCVRACLVLIVVAIPGCDGKKTTSTEEASQTAQSGPAASSGRDLPGGRDRSEKTQTAARFQDEAARSGLEFTYTNDEQQAHYAVVEIVGGGVGLVDFDLDGYLDVVIPGGGSFLPANMETNRVSQVISEERIVSLPRETVEQTDHPTRMAVCDELDDSVGSVRFDEREHGEKVQGTRSVSQPAAVKGEGAAHPRLVGRPTGLFRHVGPRQYRSVTVESYLGEQPYYSHGVAAADVDQDGFVDLLITGYGGLVFWHNQGDGTFREQTAASQLAPGGWSTSAAWGDINQDGWLDLYVAHYLDWSFENHPRCVNEEGRRDVCGPKRLGPLPDRLLLGEPTGEFREVTRDYGLRTDGKGLGVVIGDIDLDGDSDIYVANDTTQNFLYRNEGPGKLVECGLPTGCGFDPSGAPDGSMGTDLADFDGDGWPDLWVVNFEQETFALYRNVGDGTFLHASEATGMAAEAGLYVGWGTHFFDFDRDTDLDVFVSNGAPFQFPVNSPRRQLPLLFENHDQRRFTNVARRAGRYTSEPHDGRGVAIGDLENRGVVDLVVSHINEPVALLRNETVTQGQWLGLQLVGRSGTRQASGAIVEIEAAGRRQVSQVKGGGSYLSTSDPRLFFGLGQATLVDRITIRWPQGETQTIERLPAGQHWVVREGEAARPLASFPKS